MSDKEISPEFDFSGFTEMLDDRASNITMSLVLAVVVVVLAYTTMDLASLNKEVRGLVEGENTWEITFEIQTLTFQEVVVMADGEQRQIDIEVAPGDVPEGYRIGSIGTVVSYAETSGLPADPADSVAANAPQTDMMAQWNDDNNTLSGSSNDASDIELSLRTHPGFTGQNINGTGLNEYQVLQPWLVEGYGIGTYSVVLELNTQSPPFLTDSDEEITVNIQVVFFKPSATSA
tara:strand:+ start:1496 stop:2194 length:699 start_codon:yes stop_codon:yes gene_type:complete